MGEAHQVFETLDSKEKKKKTKEKTTKNKTKKSNWILKRAPACVSFAATAWCYFPAIAGTRQHITLPRQSELDDRRLRHTRKRNVTADLSAMIYGQIISQRL